MKHSGGSRFLSEVEFLQLSQISSSRLHRFRCTPPRAFNTRLSGTIQKREFGSISPFEQSNPVEPTALLALLWKPLHTGQDHTPSNRAREFLGPNRMIGLSTHSAQQAQAGMSHPPGTIDYFAVGPVFATLTKLDYEPVGLERVQ